MTTSTQTMLNHQMTAQANSFDEIYAEEDPFETLNDAPLEIRVDRQLTIILCTGGPHVEAVATLSSQGITNARLDGYWAGARDSWPITEGTALWRALEEYAETIG